MSQYTKYPPPGSGSSGVSSLNGQTGALTLVAGSNITITPGVGTLTIASTGGGGGANTALSNLASTAVNADIIPGADDAVALGSSAFAWDNITSYFLTVDSIEGKTLVGGTLDIRTPDVTGPDAASNVSLTGGFSVDGTGGAIIMQGGNASGLGDGGYFSVSTGSTNSGASGDIFLFTGGSTSGSTGNVNLQTGATGGTRGRIILNGASTDASSKKIINLANGTNPTDAVNLNQISGKLSTTLTNTHILVGNASNVATDVAASGDLTLANTGAFTVAKIQGTNVSGTTGSGNVVFSTSPTLVTPALGTPSSLVGTNITGTAAGLTAGNVTTNANLTGDVTSVGNATTLATVNGNVGTFGTATQTSTFTVNAKGLITAASNTSIQIAESQVTNLVSDLAAKQATITIGALDAQAANANGLALVSNVLSTQSADATHPGMVNNTTQTFSGAKTFPAPLTITGSNTSALTINTSSFIFDSTNNSLGIGVAPGTNAFIDAVNSTGATKRVQLTGYGTGSFVGNRGRFARGTSGTPAAAQSGDILSFISAQGYGTTGFSAASTSLMNMVAAATFTDTSMPTYMTFSTTPTASVTTAEVVRINTTGAVLINTTTDDASSKLQVNGAVNVLNNNIIHIKQAVFDSEIDNGNSGTTKTIDWTSGSIQKVLMTGSCTFTFTAPTGVSRIQLKITQNGTGNFTATWPAAVKWPTSAPVITPTANAIDIVTFYYDGTNYFAVDTQNFV